jgi:DNA-3-methyladenine glycosylase II
MIMSENNSASRIKSASLKIVEPYDFALTLRAIRSFQPNQLERGEGLNLVARISGTPVLIEVTQNPSTKNQLKVSSDPKANIKEVRRIAEWVLFAELDLTPFYSLLAKTPRLRALKDKLYGLKPTRPVTLFEMAVTAITEQQISLAAANKIRSRIEQKFGEPVVDRWVFPEPQTLAKALFEDLRSCGLSRQKTQYILDLAGKIAGGTLDLDVLKKQDDDTARETIMNLRGFGRWSADYILIRGLARPDCVPVDDLGIRDVVGEYLGNGQRVSALEVTNKLEPFRPYRGLLAFYLLADHRLKL